MEQLKQKIEQWFVDNGIKINTRLISLTTKKEFFTVKFTKKYIYTIEFSPYKDMYEISFYRSDTDPFIIKNQTEQNIFALLNVLKNHLRL